MSELLLIARFLQLWTPVAKILLGSLCLGSFSPTPNIHRTL